MTKLKVGGGGEISLPEDVRRRHGFAPSTPVRVIETRTGVLLIVLDDAPISSELARELAEWQALGAASWENFPYSETDE